MDCYWYTISVSVGTALLLECVEVIVVTVHNFRLEFIQVGNLFEDLCFTFLINNLVLSEGELRTIFECVVIYAARILCSDATM